MTRAIGYIRVSSDKQVESGLSLEAQEEKARAYCKLYDIDLVHVEVEGLTAKDLNRPGLQRCLSMLKEGQADSLLVVKLDRLTRSVRDLGTLLEDWFGPGRFSLISVAESINTKTAAGRLVLNVLASVAQWEREAIGERTTDALKVKKARGEATGGDAPYGWSFEYRGGVKCLVACPNEQEIISNVKLLHSKGWAAGRIAMVLNMENAPARGARWHKTSVARILGGVNATSS